MNSDPSIEEQLVSINAQLLQIRQMLERALPPPRAPKRRATLDAAMTARAHALFVEGRSLGQVAKELEISKTSAFHLRQAMRGGETK